MREQGTGRSTTLAQHLIQSFAPGEVTPEEALAIGTELCERYLKDQYQYVLAVHTDHEHLHCHIVFNNTNIYTHRTFETEENQGGKSYRAWAKLRAISDEICREHGISVIEQPKSKGKSHFEWEMEKVGKSWKAKLRQALRELITYSKSFDDFLKKCVENGIEYDYTPQNKVKLKFRFKDEGQQRFTRADTLGAEFEPEAIIATIETTEKKAAAEQAEKFLAARRARRNAEIVLQNHSAVVTTPKNEPTVTASTKPTVVESTMPTKLVTPELLARVKAMKEAQAQSQTVTPTDPQPTADKTDTAKSEYVYKPTSDEEFFNVFGVHLDEVNTPDTTAPTESQAPETEEVDPWEKFRELGYSDKDIEKLENGGIMSFDELHGFMIVGKEHPQDHRKEIADLKEQISDLETLISNIKRKNELVPIHTKYESKSGWFKTQYKKKHNDDIYDYGKADVYIREHINQYKSKDGKTPTLKELQTKLKDLRAKLKPLVKENDIYEAKTHLAYPYVKKMRHNQMVEL